LGSAFNPFGVEKVYFFCCHRISCGVIDVEALPAAGRPSGFNNRSDSQTQRDSDRKQPEEKNPEGI
jgi:hypothetical protein